ncbi:MAG: ABC transporter ATP-binding protein [Thermoleophilia bacterium]|nr:ABC transporter ATP-binding protein [Thermoleophilia bacterium]
MAAAVEIEGLTKSYGSSDGEVRAVDWLSFRVEQGEVFGFLGPNGAGKTTTVQILMQVIFPTSGSARLLGKPLGDLESRSQIGYLPELCQFHSHLRADEFLDFHGRLYGMPAGARRKRIDEVLELVGLSENRKSRIRTFSKGMMQRIGIGQAIINNPRLLFLDEPASALDPMGRRDMRDLLMSLKDRGTTVFMNSHLLSEVEMTCARVGIMNRGKLVQVSDLKSMIKPGHTVEIRAAGITDRVMEQIRDLAKRVQQDDGCLMVTVDKEELLSHLARMIMESGANLMEFTPRQMPLEEAFLQLIQESDA